MDARSALIAARHETASIAIAAATLSVGTAVLIAWTWDLPGLSAVHPVFGAMGSHTAICFVVAAAALLLLRAPVTPARRALAAACATAVVSACAIVLGQRFGGVMERPLPVSMPTASAEVFVALGLALLLIDVRIGRWRPAEFLCFTATLIALLALVAFAYGSLSIVAPVSPRPLALHSVLLMVAFSFAVLAARPRSGLMALATGDNVAGLLVRRMLPAAVVIPVLAGWLVVEAQRASWIPPALALPYYAIAIVFVFATMTWQTAASLRRVDVQRLAAQHQVQQLNAGLERRVAERTAELERVNAELEAFSYSVSHDLRAPLRHIDGFAQMLRSGQADRLDATGVRHLAVICDSARSMGRMIDDLLSLARLDRRAVEYQVADLNAIVRAVVQELQADLAGRQIEWTFDDLPPTRCDPGLMKIVFTNLISNAVKYTARRERSAIAVSWRHTPEGGVFAIADNGAGFDEQYRHKLFGVFQRLHRADEFEGTGIGLATVRRIVHKHGGRIWAEGAVGKGATFSFTLGSSNGAEGATVPDGAAVREAREKR